MYTVAEDVASLDVCARLVPFDGLQSFQRGSVNVFLSILSIIGNLQITANLSTSQYSPPSAIGMLIIILNDDCILKLLQLETILKLRVHK